MGILDGKRILVAGVTMDSSIGFATARVAQEEGATVLVSNFGRALGITRRIVARLPKEAPVLEGHKGLRRATWEWTFETGSHALRLIFGGLFDRFPRARIGLGHLGETLPFLLWRIDQALSRPGAKPMSFRDVFSTHIYLTTSGNFSNPALLCCVQELGIDRIMFAVDWPFVANPLGTKWVDTIPLCDEDKIKLLSGNAKRLLRM